MDKSKSPPTTDLKSSLSRLENIFNEYLVKKAPFTIPGNIKQIIVNIAPWLMLIGLIFSIPAVLIVLGLGTLVAPFAFLGGLRAGVTFSISAIFMVVILILEAMALPGLFKKTVNGWKMVYYATLLGVVQNIITFSLGGLIIGSLLSLYILFQVREYYK